MARDVDELDGTVAQQVVGLAEGTLVVVPLELVELDHAPPFLVVANLVGELAREANLVGGNHEALGICIPGGATQALAQEVGDAAIVSDHAPGVTAEDAVIPTNDAAERGPNDVAKTDERATGSVTIATNADDERSGSVESAASASGLAATLDDSTLYTQAEGTDASAFFHPTITTESDSIANGQYAAFNVKYTIDHGQINAGDYVLVTVSDALRDVTLSVSSQVFAEKIDLGNGQYKLVFNENATNGISGSFSISAFGKNESDSSTTATVTVGDVSKTISVGAGSHGGGVGPETRGIIKWGYEGEGYTQDTASSGVFDQDRDVTVTYAIEVDPRMSAMTGATVTDELPPEMSLDPSSIRIVTEYADGQTGPELPADEVARIVTVSGNAMSFNFADMLDGTKFFRIYYDATVPAGTKVRLTNRSSISYVGENGPDAEISSFTLKPMSGYSSSIGYKSVDKVEVSDDPDDQTVTYTIVFENDQAFEANEINLTDALDARVAYVDSYGSDYFNLTYDEESHSVSITNAEAIPASSR